MIPPQTTFDLDWTLPPTLTERDQGLHERMLESGFTARRSGAAKLPVVQYVPTGELDEMSGIYIEFLAPRRGSKQGRTGTNQAILEVQPGLFAQTDPYLGLLLALPLEAAASDIPELGLSSVHSVRLPNPMSFIVQKTLIRPRRDARKQENDLCHIYDVVSLTHDRWGSLCTMPKQLRKCGFPKLWVPKARAALGELFASSTSPGPLAVCRNYPGLVSGPDAVQVMAAFMEECWQQDT